MSLRLRRGLTPGRLRLVLGTVFLALALPSVALIWQTQRQLKWESFHQYRQLAEEMAGRIDARLRAAVAGEEARTYADYRFLLVAGDPSAGYLQRSPLASWPLRPQLPGLIGYFQVDADGRFSTPLLPEDLTRATELGLGKAELVERTALRDRLLSVLSENHLIERRRDSARYAPPAPPQPRASYLGSRADADAGAAPSAEQPAIAQRGFDELEAAPRAESKRGLGRIDDLKLEQAFEEQRQRKAAPAPAARAARREQNLLPEAEPASPTAGPQRVRIFESQVDPFAFSLLDSGHFVLHRKVWHDGERVIQGAIIEQAPFLREAVQTTFAGSGLAQMSDLVVAYQGDVLQVVPGVLHSSPGGELQGTLLHRARLASPLDGVELVWTINRLPAGPGASIVIWSSVVLLSVLTAGFLLLYRLGMRQLHLARQQQDFVSAVSHELRTPLTSIRMYGELLREGWASEEKKRQYYDYIHDEAERLSRLIANVLQLARMERRELKLELRELSVATLADLLRSKVASQIARAGFECELEVAPACAHALLRVDSDAFTQIVINLVDNALKFSAQAECKRIQIRAVERGGQVLWSVRDYGPGVPRAQMKKIFRLFYRPGDELTRETVGTGIGLALVQQLTLAMGGRVDVVNREPGAEFQILLPALSR